MLIVANELLKVYCQRHNLKTQTFWVPKLMHIIQTAMTSTDTRLKLFKRERILNATKDLNKCNSFNAVYQPWQPLLAVNNFEKVSAWDLVSYSPVLRWTWRMKYRLVHSLILTTVLDGWKKEAESVFIQSIELPVVHIIGK